MDNSKNDDYIYWDMSQIMPDIYGVLDTKEKQLVAVGRGSKYYINIGSAKTACRRLRTIAIEQKGIGALEANERYKVIRMMVANGGFVRCM